MNTTSRRAVITIFSAATLAAAATTATAQGSSGNDGVAPSAVIAPQASISISNCPTPKSDFITNDNFDQTTTSTTYVDVAGMTKQVTQARRGCVIVEVSAFAYTIDDDVQFVSVELDGVLGNPIEVQFSGDDDEDDDGGWARAHAAVFAFANVSAGAHTVSMVHHSGEGNLVVLHRPAMHILHR